MNNPITKAAAALVALFAIVTLAACQANTITGPSGAPLAVVVTSENPTTDLLTSYRRSITYSGAANSDVVETFHSADTLATNNNGQLVAVVYSQDWYDGLSVPSGTSRATYAGQVVQNILPDTGPANRICNAVFIDASIPTAGRQAIADSVNGFGRYELGAKFQYRAYTADPGNELQAYVDACYSEGV